MGAAVSKEGGVDKEKGGETPVVYNIHLSLPGVTQTVDVLVRPSEGLHMTSRPWYLGDYVKVAAVTWRKIVGGQLEVRMSYKSGHFWR